MDQGWCLKLPCSAGSPVFRHLCFNQDNTTESVWWNIWLQKDQQLHQTASFTKIWVEKRNQVGALIVVLSHRSARPWSTAGHMRKTQHVAMILGTVLRRWNRMNIQLTSNYNIIYCIYNVTITKVVGISHCLVNSRLENSTVLWLLANLVYKYPGNCP